MGNWRLSQPPPLPCLLQASQGNLEEAGHQWIAVFSQTRTASRPAVATAAVTSAPTPAEKLLGDCRSAAPHRRNFSSQELALQEQRYRAWQAGTARGVAMCLAVKGGDSRLLPGRVRVLSCCMVTCMQLGRRRHSLTSCAACPGCCCRPAC